MNASLGRVSGTQHLRNASLGDTAFAALRAVLGTQHLQSWGHSICAVSGTQPFNERAHFHMYSSPQSRCKAQ